jgi:hypothetical protein
MHHPYWFVGSETRVGARHFVAEPLFPIGHAVGKDDADGLVQVEAALGRAAYVQVNEVTQSWAVWASDGSVFGGGHFGFDDGPG